MLNAEGDLGMHAKRPRRDQLHAEKQKGLGFGETLNSQTSKPSTLGFGVFGPLGFGAFRGLGFRMYGGSCSSIKILAYLL